MDCFVAPLLAMTAFSKRTTAPPRSTGFSRHVPILFGVTLVELLVSFMPPL
jgi:hypothetical protein